MEKCKVLQICAGSDAMNGVDNILVQYYNNINKEKIRFDFLYCAGDKNEERMYSLLSKDYTTVFQLNTVSYGSSVFSFIKLFFRLCSFFKKHHYDFVHINTGSRGIQICSVLAAKLYSKSIIISHSHAGINGNNTLPEKNIIKALLKKLSKNIIVKKSDYLFSCSEYAGVFMFGDTYISSNKKYTMNNAVEIERFKYDDTTRKKKRNELNIDEKATIYGHVGRFSLQKNQSFLIDIFNEIYKKDINSFLVLVGEGPYLKEIKDKVNDLSLSENVLFLGQREDVNELMQAFDSFIFPSLWEGLSLVLVEAQAAGLGIVSSDTISPEHKMIPNYYFVSLQESPVVWAEKALSLPKNKSSRLEGFYRLKKAGYDIKDAAINLQNFYLSNKMEEKR